MDGSAQFTSASSEAHSSQNSQDANNTDDERQIGAAGEAPPSSVPAGVAPVEAHPVGMGDADAAGDGPRGDEPAQEPLASEPAIVDTEVRPRIYNGTLQDAIDKGRVITGSSNFTQSGLVNNIEFKKENTKIFDVYLAAKNFSKPSESTNKFLIKGSANATSLALLAISSLISPSSTKSLIMTSSSSDRVH